MSSVRVLLVLSAVIAAVACSAVVSPDSDERKVSAQVMSDVVSVESGDAALDESKAVTPYGYKATMLQASGRKILCWRCSSPCSAYMCCDDGYPQCCLVSGYCRCCRF